jgi:hypothetical protein
MQLGGDARQKAAKTERSKEKQPELRANPTKGSPRE